MPALAVDIYLKISYTWTLKIRDLIGRDQTSGKDA